MGRKDCEWIVDNDEYERIIKEIRALEEAVNRLAVKITEAFGNFTDAIKVLDSLISVSWDEWSKYARMILEGVVEAVDPARLEALREPYSAKRRKSAAKVERVKRERAQARQNRRPPPYLLEAKKCKRLARSDLTLLQTGAGGIISRLFRYLKSEKVRQTIKCPVSTA